MEIYFVKKLNIYILIPILAFLISCSAESTRIGLLEEELNIKLPETYEQVINSTEGGNDYEINIELKFQTAEFEQIISQVKNTKYYVSKTHQGLDSSIKQTIEADTTINGFWKRTNKGFEFYKSRNKNEPVRATLDTVGKILRFNFIHL